MSGASLIAVPLATTPYVSRFGEHIIAFPPRSCALQWYGQIGMAAAIIVPGTPSCSAARLSR